MEYESKIIHEHAERLYSQSKSIVPIQFFIWLFAGMITFMGITAALNLGFDFLLIALGTLIGGVIGYGSGKNRSFELKLQAHQALCLAKIEENTR